jgi:hypothetical protein
MMTEPTAREGETRLGPEAWPSDDAGQVRRIEAMPREVGVLLVVAGVGGLLLPGPVGSPFLILGGVILWPRVFGKVETWFEKRFPRLHHRSMRQIVRFLDDLERRYPLNP